jgi:hypothetical protein
MTALGKSFISMCQKLLQSLMSPVKEARSSGIRTFHISYPDKSPEITPIE